MKPSGILFLTIFLLMAFYSCDINEFAPEINDQEFAIEENSPGGTAVGTIEASDLDDGQILSFEITEGNDNGVFELNPSSGSLLVKDPAYLDYESNPQYILTVTVSDNHKIEPLLSTAEVLINVLDVNEIPETGMVAYYPGNGDSNDISGNDFHLINHGVDFCDDRFGNTRGAIRCDGSNGLVLLDQSMNNQSDPQSISLWFRTSSLNNVEYGGLLFGLLNSTGIESGSRLVLSVTEGFVRATYGANTSYEHFLSKTTYNDNQWHHVAFISNGDNNDAVFIVDGIVLESRTLTMTNNQASNQLDVKVGGDKSQNYFTGDIDDIILYDRALSTEEVSIIFVEKAYIPTLFNVIRNAF